MTLLQSINHDLQPVIQPQPHKTPGYLLEIAASLRTWM